MTEIRIVDDRKTNVFCLVKAILNAGGMAYYLFLGMSSGKGVATVKDFGWAEQILQSQSS
jgi:hypothetical protein